MRTVTFYSYKGGVGRTLTLANMAMNLRLQGANVVALDLDLEAPGLHYKLNRDPEHPLPPVKRGLVDILFDFVEGRPLPERLDDHVIDVRKAEGSKGWIKLLPAGTAPLSDYWRKLARIDWHQLFYSKDELGAPLALGVPLFLELKERIAEAFTPDYLLIDSRTGITEMGGICTAVLPDQVVCLLLRNQEHLDGSRAVLRGILGAPRMEAEEPIEITPVLARFPLDIGSIAREQELSRINAFLNEPGEDEAQTLEVKDVIVLRADPSLEENERILLEDEASVGRGLAEDYLTLCWNILPPEQRPQTREREMRRAQPYQGWAPVATTFVLPEPVRPPSWETMRTTGDRVLRITEIAGSTPGRYQVEVSLEGAGPRLTATVPLAFELDAQDRGRIRWYLEDYLLFPLDPAPKLAADIERRMAELGDALCQAVFFGNRDAMRLWDRAREELAHTRIEVVTDVRHAASVPWELIRDPDSKTPLALEAESFVRAHRMPTKLPRGAPDTSGGPVRILLVICRPRAGQDVPFRSVAAHLVKGLDQASREVVELDVLRPPTFDALARRLRAAKDRGKPYHVVHFDGHGVYLDGETKKIHDIVAGVRAEVLGGERTGMHGYLLFEAAEEAAQDNGELIDGPRLGKLLVETGVPVLVLNACRSAHADPPPEPEEVGKGARDPHDDVASFGSLALEVMDTGVSGVVAMRYNVFVETAARFVARLYEALANGLGLGEAVSRGRKHLADKPGRTIVYESVPLQDWCVPIVYEVGRLPLFPAPSSTRTVQLVVAGAQAGGERGALVGVPAAPDAGFFGRDETLLALDRAFDRHEVVLLHAYAGSGKSSTAAEFGRWYVRTGGVEGPVLWTSFERRMVLPQVLDVLGQVFKPMLEQNKIQWLALDDGKRRQVALQILKQVPVLWIWDNVEPVAGFPAGTASAWSAEEQQALVDFLREARGTKAKFLLTSRRDERRWLRDLPARITVPPMPMQERVQLARALAGKRGAKLGDVKDWRPLLEFTQGNPMTITVLVGQALRDGLRMKEQVEAFVAKLRAGESAFDDDEREGRSRSLGASLSYGFENAFGEDDKKRLALLHLFQGYVQASALQAMGVPDMAWCLTEVRGLTREASMALLDRAADVGLLTARGDGCYSIHPAVPWYLRRTFEEYYPEQRTEDAGSDATGAKRAYARAMGDLGNFYCKLYENGSRGHLAILLAEEPNLLHARDLARRHGWWEAIIGTMQGMLRLYEHLGRRSEWTKLVGETTFDFVDAETGGPLPGREDGWGLITDYRVRLAREAQQWAEAEPLQQAKVSWARQRASAFLAVPVEALDDTQRHWVRSLAVSLEGLGQIQVGREQSECIETFLEATELAKRVGDRAEEGTIAANLGNAYLSLPAIRDLTEAERWYKRALEILGEEQRHLRGQCFGQLGSVAFERFREASTARRPKEELLAYLNTALRFLREALDLIPPDAVHDLAILHNAAGTVFGSAGYIDRAMEHLQLAIRNSEQTGNVYEAAQARQNAARALMNVGRLAEARAYAVASLHDFETYGDRAATTIQHTRDLIVDLDHRLSTQRPT